MKYFDEANGRYLETGQQFRAVNRETGEEIQHGETWLEFATDEQLAAVGLVPVKVVGELKDSEMFDNVETLVRDTLTITSTPKPPPTPAQIALAKIAALESSVTDRRIREAVLGIDSGWLAALNAEIVALRKEL